MSDALTTISAPGYEFTRDWFKKNQGPWSNFFENLRPTKVLEIGSYEGFSACWMIAQSQIIGSERFELHCIDSWEGGAEHRSGVFETEMSAVEQRFTSNLAKARQETSLPSLEVHIHKKLSHLALADFIAERRLGYFDLIYIDGSHRAPDVLTDAVMSFPLLAVDGMMVFDDYLWTMERKGFEDLLNMPKPAVDAFTNLFMRQMRVIRGGTREQLYLRKHSD
jgi:predicted O-methyltransferase YrrM